MGNQPSSSDGPQTEPPQEFEIKVSPPLPPPTAAPALIVRAAQFSPDFQKSFQMKVEEATVERQQELQLQLQQQQQQLLRQQQKHLRQQRQQQQRQHHQQQFQQQQQQQQEQERAREQQRPAEPGSPGAPRPASASEVAEAQQRDRDEAHRRVKQRQKEISECVSTFIPPLSK